MTWRDATYWSASDSFSAVFTNGRRNGWTYDAAGNVTNDTTNTYTYDAVGRNATVQSILYPTSSTQWLDGDGLTVKRQSAAQGIYYYLRSSAMGGKVVTEIHGDTVNGSYGYGWVIGSKAKGYVYASTGLMAEQTSYYYYGAPNESVKWVHNDPHTGSEVSSWTGGVAYTEHEFDPLGIDTGFDDPANYNPPSLPDPEQPSYTGSGSNPFGPKCSLDGISVDCSFAFQMVESGSAVVAPSQTVTPVYAYNKQARKGSYIGFAQWNFKDQYFHFNGGYTKPNGEYVATHLSVLWEGRSFPLMGIGLGIGFGGPEQRLPLYVILVGDPGLGRNNAGKNFMRAAETRATALRAQGNEVRIARVSTIEQFNDNLSFNCHGREIDGGVIFFGHGGGTPEGGMMLYIGENPESGDYHPNLNASNLNKIDGRNLAPNVQVELNACDSGRGYPGWGNSISIAEMLANRLGRVTIGSTTGMLFSGRPDVITDRKRPPSSGPLYMVPDGGQMVPFRRR